MRGDLVAEEAGCLKTCQCGITTMTADYTFGMTIGADAVCHFPLPFYFLSYTISHADLLVT